MKSKQDLKSFFENGDKPNQEQFWALIESYFHKDEPISLEELSLLKANLATIDKTSNGTETLGNVDTKEQVNAKINFAINALKANAPETYDTLKEIADYIANDSNAEVALLQLINTKLDKPTMTNNYYGLWDDTNKKFVNGNIQTNGNNVGIGTNSSLLPLQIGIDNTVVTGSNTTINLGIVSKFSSSNTRQYNVIGYYGTIIDNSNIFLQSGSENNKNFYTGIISDLGYFNNSRYSIINYGIEKFTVLNSNGNVGINTITPSEKLEVSGNIKANAYKFNLQASITPTPNTLVPKTDGTRPTWYNNSSVAKDIALFEDINSTNVTNAINSASSAQKTSMRTALLGTATPASPTISHCFPSFIKKEVTTNVDLNGLNLTLLDPVQIWIEKPDGTKCYATNFMNYSTTLIRTTWLIPADFPDGEYSVKIQNGIASQGLSTGTLTVLTNYNVIDLYDTNWKNILRTTSDTGSSYTINSSWLNNNIRTKNYMRTQLPINNEDYVDSDETGGNLFMTNNFIQINKDYEIIIETNINIGYPGTGAYPTWWLGLTKTESSTIVNISDVIKDNYIDGNQSGFWGYSNLTLNQFYKIVLYKTGNIILAKLFDPNGTYMKQKQWTISNFDNNLSLFIRDFRQRTTHATREFKFTIKEKP